MNSETGTKRCVVMCMEELLDKKRIIAKETISMWSLFLVRICD